MSPLASWIEQEYLSPELTLREVVQILESRGKQLTLQPIPLPKPAFVPRMLVLDVDGVLTPGSLWYTARGEEGKLFHVRDGYAIQHAIRKGLVVAIISAGRQEEVVRKRAEDLGIAHVYVGRDPKEVVLQQMCKRLAIRPAECAYCGDDYTDLAAMALCGFVAAPADAASGVKKEATIVLQTPGGMGCVRELIEDVFGLVGPPSG